MAAAPLALAAGVKVRSPVDGLTAGPALNRAVSVLFVMVKARVWPLSSAGPLEMAPAQAGKDWAPASSSTVLSGPLLKDGTSLTAVTSMVKVWAGERSTPPLAVPPLSFSRRVIVAEPLASAAGVKLRSPVDGSTAGPALNRAVLVLFVTVKARVWPLSSAGPLEMALAQPGKVWAPASSSTVLSGPLLKDGASLTAVTLRLIRSLSHMGGAALSQTW